MDAEYIGGRVSIAAAARHLAKNLKEIGDLDFSLRAEKLAQDIEARNDAEDTREFPLPLKEKDE